MVFLMKKEIFEFKTLIYKLKKKMEFQNAFIQNVIHSCKKIRKCNETSPSHELASTIKKSNFTFLSWEHPAY